MEPRRASDQLSDLEVLSKRSDTIALKGPWGDFYGWIRDCKVVDVLQVGGNAPELIVEVTAARREEA